MTRLPRKGWSKGRGTAISRGVTLRLPRRPLLALAGLALLAPVGASAANPSPVAAPSNPTPVAATPSQPSTPSTSSHTSTYTPARTYTPSPPSGPTAAQLAAQRAAARRVKAQAKAHKLALQRQRHQHQLLAAAQTHAEAVLRTELAAARRTDAVDTLAVSVADSIGAAPAGELPRAAASSGASSGGGGSIPLPALALAACAGLLGIGAAFASRRGVGFATAALSLIVLLVAGI
jgi:hypothetical protein